MSEINIIARKYIGKTEKPGNSGFNDADFQKKMEAVGWSRAMAWCAFFVELVCCEAQPYSTKLKELFSGSAIKTFENFKKEGKTVEKPAVGNLIVWRHGNTWQGHIGIIDEIIDEDTVIAIEGNTNDLGGREGYIVAKRTRKLNQKYNPRGLNVEGFIAI